MRRTESSAAASYNALSLFPGWSGAEAYVTDLINAYSCKSVLEVGAGANPTLSPATVQNESISYTLSDVELGELAKAELYFDQVVLDLETTEFNNELRGQFDCVFSRMVGEHINDGRLFHENIYKLLRPGGISFHCFSTLWAAPFVVNRLVPEFISSRLHQTFDPRDYYKHRKFPARYSWCRGPSKAMFRRFEELGFEVRAYSGYFGHNYYYKMPWLDMAEKLKARLLLRLPSPLLCSYATVLLQKK